MSIPPTPRAVVTGGASGLGHALCIALAKRHAKIVIADLDVPGAEQTAHEAQAAGAQVAVQRCDVSEVGQVEQLADFSAR